MIKYISISNFVLLGFMFGCANNSTIPNQPVNSEEPTSSVERPVEEPTSSVERPVLEYVSKCLTPAETLRSMDKILRDTVDVLEETGITYWLDSGTLLGAYRFGSHMPFDDDVDLGMLAADYTSKKDALIAALKQRGYTLMRSNYDAGSWDAPYVVSNQDKDHIVRLDFFLVEPTSKTKDSFAFVQKLWNTRIKSGEFSRNIIFGPDGALDSADLLGRKYKVPVNIQKYLEEWYSESNILTNFYFHQNHTPGYCQDHYAKTNDIRRDSIVLGKMTTHLRETYGTKFTLEPSRKNYALKFENTEFVFAHYKENLDWIIPVLDIATVYHKGPPEYPRISSKEWKPLRNLGREGHTYLTHIIENYDNLAEITVFLQGSIEDHSKHKNWLDLATEAQREGFSSLTPLVEDRGADYAWLSTDIRYNIGLQKPKIELPEFYEMIFEVKPIGFVPVTYNGCFAVRRDKLIRHPKALYEKILSYLDHPNPTEGHFLERAWYCMFNDCSELRKK